MSIAMSQGMRNVVYSLVDMQEQINTANERLSTGKKVNSAIDNASAYFRAQGFQKESRDLASLLDFMDAGLRAVTKITNSLDSSRKLIESAQSLARQAVSLATGDTAGRDALGTQAAELVNQAAKILNDSGFGGTSLLQTNATAPTSLTILTNAATTTAAQTSIVINTADLRFGQATGIASGATNAGDRLLASGVQG